MHAWLTMENGGWWGMGRARGRYSGNGQTPILQIPNKDKKIWILQNKGYNSFLTFMDMELPSAAPALSKNGFPDEIFDQAIDAADTIIRELEQEFSLAAAGRLSLPNQDINAGRDQATIEYTHALLVLHELQIIFDKETEKKPEDRKHPADLIAFYELRQQSLLNTLPPSLQECGKKGKACALSRLIDFYARNNGKAPQELGVASVINERSLGILTLKRGPFLTIAQPDQEQEVLEACQTTESFVFFLVRETGEVLATKIGTRLELLAWFERNYVR